LCLIMVLVNIWKMACERELVRFALVDSVVLRLLPSIKICMISAVFFTTCKLTPAIAIPLSGSSLKSNYSDLPLVVRSLIFSF
jgi:hypothetical protein